MNSDHSVRDWLEEAVPIALVLAVWNLLAAIFPWGGLSTALRWTGIAIALVYVVSRALAHAEHVDPPVWDDITAVVETNVQVLTAAGVWFAAAFVIYLFQTAWQALYRWANAPFPNQISTPVDWLASALATTGLGVALIVLLAATLSIHRDGPASVEEGFTLSTGTGGEGAGDDGSAAGAVEESDSVQDDTEKAGGDADDEEDGKDTDAEREADRSGDGGDTETDSADESSDEPDDESSDEPDDESSDEPDDESSDEG